MEINEVDSDKEDKERYANNVKKMLSIQEIRFTKKKTQRMQKNDKIENLVKNLENIFDKEIVKISKVENRDNLLEKI